MPRTKKTAPSIEPGPKKLPKTQRSQDIFDAILDATAVVLQQEGIEGLTSNKISQKAGVSVGSFYQYFPNKESVLAELSRRQEERAYVLLRERMVDAEPTMESIAKSMISALASEDFGDIEMRRTLLGQVPLAWARSKSLENDQRLQDMVNTLLDSFGDEIRDGDRDVMTFILIHLVEQLVEAAVWRRPDLIGDPRFINELVLLALRYIRP